MARNKFLNPLLGYWGYGVRSLAFDPGNKVLVTGGDQGYVSRWDLATGEELPRWQTQHGLLFNIAFSPDGTLLASACGDGTVQIWNSSTGEPLELLQGHTYGAWSVVWSNDGSELVTGAGDGTIKVWNPGSGTLEREKAVTFTKINSLQFSRTVRIWRRSRSGNGHCCSTRHRSMKRIRSRNFSAGCGRFPFIRTADRRR